MDFLDPHKQRRHTIMLYTGYVLIAIAIIISTIVLVYQANGFGVNGKGQVVQNGLLFFSSQPNPADIYINGHKNSAQTNSRLSLPSGQYSVRLSRTGYRNWQRNITVQGGDVQHFDYPFLFPSKLVTKSQADFKTAPALASQSRDHRWLLIQPDAAAPTFLVYDLKDPTTPSETITLPATVARGSTAAGQSWQALQWADDNQHVLVQHQYAGGTDFIVIDRSDVTKSANLNTTFNVNPASVTLIDNKYDQYHLLTAVNGDLLRASLGNPDPTKLLGNVLSYKSYGSKTVLYASAAGAADGKVDISLFNGNNTYIIRTVPADTTYLLDMAGFQGKPYVALSAASEGTLYIYADPVAQLGDPKVKLPVAIRAIKVASPSYIAFSPNTQYVVAENANQFGVYDIYLKHAFVYSLKQPFDAAQPHASWMDGNRLTYVTQSKLLAFDYDHRNVQTLMSAEAAYLPFFSPDYHYVYALSPAANGSFQLTRTALLTAADL